MSDLLRVSFDMNKRDTPVLLITRENGDKTQVIKVFKGPEAIAVYNFLTVYDDKEDSNAKS